MGCCFSKPPVADDPDIPADADAEGDLAPCGSDDGGGGVTADEGKILVPCLGIMEFRKLTNNFDQSFDIGGGTFGRVYYVENLNGQPAAVMKSRSATSQPLDEFLSGVARLSRLQSPSVVKLLAYCEDTSDRVLAFEYARHGSLHDILHGKQGGIGTGGIGTAVPGMSENGELERPLALSWAQRVKIALGAARGLRYLHEQANPPVVHKAVMSANVFIFDGFEAKIADVNVASEAPDQNSVLISDHVLGSTFVYLAPEYASGCALTQKSDVYSFGMVLLEILTGCTPHDSSRQGSKKSLKIWAEPLLSEDKVEQCVDPNLQGEYPPKDLAKFAGLASMCLWTDPDRRPSMRAVVRTLKTLAKSEGGT